MYIYIYMYILRIHIVYNVWLFKFKLWLAMDLVRLCVRSDVQRNRCGWFKLCFNVDTPGNPFFIDSGVRFSRGWVRKDGNLLRETGRSRRRENTV